MENLDENEHESESDNSKHESIANNNMYECIETIVIDNVENIYNINIHDYKFDEKLKNEILIMLPFYLKIMIMINSVNFTMLVLKKYLLIILK